MLLELGGGWGHPPENCIGEDADFLRPLGTIWFNDAEVAEYARQIYKMPAYYGEFNVIRQTAGGVNVQEWTWSTPGGVASKVTFPDVDVPTGRTSVVTRLYWFPDGEVYAFDWLEEWDVSSGAIQGGAFRPATGTFEDPMLFATSSDHREFAGRSERFINVAMSASFVRFGDEQCESPLT